MILKAMSEDGYRKQNNNVAVDTCVCQKCILLRDSDALQMMHVRYSNYFQFLQVSGGGKDLWFLNYFTRECIIISEIKNGVVTVEPPAGEYISNFVHMLRKIFVPYSIFFGVKALEVSFNSFSIRMDDNNSDRILYLYRKSCSLLSLLEEKELQEYCNSPEYISKHAKFLKAEYRKKVVIQKLRDFQNNGQDFAINSKEGQAMWQKLKKLIQMINTVEL